MLHLLPDYHKQQVIAEYRNRVLIVFSVGILILVIISAVFLIPVYISTHGRYSVVAAQRESIEAQIAGGENTDDAEKVKEIVSAVEVLKSYTLSEYPSEIFTRILRVKPSGIKITGFIYTPPANQIGTVELSSVDISGVASTRIALSKFNDELKKDKVFKSVFVPISSFAKDKDIVFTVKLTISREPADWGYSDSAALTSTTTLSE